MVHWYGAQNAGEAEHKIDKVLTKFLMFYLGKRVATDGPKSIKEGMSKAAEVDGFLKLRGLQNC